MAGHQARVDLCRRYAWKIGGNSATGQTVSATFSSGGNATASATVSDGRGGTTTGSQGFIVGTGAGTWSGSGTNLGNFTMDLTQTNGSITGSYNDSFGPGTVGPTGAPGTIDGNGNVELRAKPGNFTDFTFKGTMDATGRRNTGGIFGSGFTGQSFTMTK